MKNIAILRCIRAEENCIGALCLKVFNGKGAFFERYRDEDIQLVAFMTCNGCEGMAFVGDAGIQEKLARLVSIGTNVVHIGMCCQTRTKSRQKCEKIEEIVKFLQAHKIDVVWGTHN